ncbi:MAG: hypothetical protein AB7N80_11560 [Bdellovibrionales bacterium]
MGFKSGDVPTSAVLDIPDGQVVVMRRWNDGSVKHAIISGHAALAANVAKTVTILRGTTGAQTALTAANIQAANPSAVVSLGALGSVNLSSLLATPVRTFISGPEMVEAHYQGATGGVLVYFHVRLFKNGRIWIRANVENGHVDLSGSDKSYNANVSIGGANVFSGAITHYNHTRWTAEGWVNGNPQVMFKLNTNYLINSKLVPNYITQTPSSAVLSGLYQNYVPYQNGGWTKLMGETGYQDQIGLLPLWDALYLTSGGDERALKSVIANTKALGSYAIIYRGSTDQNLPVRPSKYPNYTVNGANGGGANEVGAGPLSWELAHHGSSGYLAYMVTGDYLALENMQHQAGSCFLYYSSTNGSGLNRLMGSQVRSVAWCSRTLGQLVALAPADSVTSEWSTYLQNNMTDLLTQTQVTGMNQLGILYEYCPGDICFNSYGSGLTSVFMHDFMVQSYGMVSDLEPFANMTSWNTVRNWLYKIPVGLLGAGGAGSYCFNYASTYTVKAAPGPVANLTMAYNNWGQVFTATFGAAACGNTLLGSSGGDPASAATGYWGNLMPAAAYSVDHNAPGASAAWGRLTSASNWPTVLNSGFNNVPIWGIVPRP